MKKIKYTDFVPIRNVLEDVALEFQKEQDSPKTKLFSLWERIIEKKFLALTKLISINDKGILTVACKSSAVSSELIMRKKDILDDIKSISDTLELKVSDIIFNHKIWKSTL